MADRDVMTGTQVEVKARFDGTWSKGFEIADIEDDGYRIRRMTDGSVLPTVFHRNEVRRDVTGTSWRRQGH